MIHSLAEAIAAGILVGGGGLLLVSGRRAPAVPPTWSIGDLTLGGSLVLSVLIASIGAALIHLAVAPEHLDELGVFGWGFILAAFLQSAVAVAFLARPTRSLAAVTAVLNLGLIAAWGWSRIFGLPFGPEAWVPEAIGRADAVCIALEAIAFVAVAGWLWLAGRRSIGTGSSVGSISIVPIVGVVVMLTILALAGTGGEHVHEMAGM